MNRVEWARILLTYRDDPSFFAVPTLKARIETLEAEMTLSGARSDRGGRWPGGRGGGGFGRTGSSNASATNRQLTSRSSSGLLTKLSRGRRSGRPDLMQRSAGRLERSIFATGINCSSTYVLPMAASWQQPPYWICVGGGPAPEFGRCLRHWGWITLVLKTSASPMACPGLRAGHWANHGDAPAKSKKCSLFNAIKRRGWPLAPPSRGIRRTVHDGSDPTCRRNATT